MSSFPLKLPLNRSGEEPLKGVARDMAGQPIQTRIARRFGVEEREVEQALSADASFRTLCRDYVLCARALAHWRDSGGEIATGRESEYAAVLDGLTKEIEAQLSALPRSDDED